MCNKKAEHSLLVYVPPKAHQDSAEDKGRHPKEGLMPDKPGKPGGTGSKRSKKNPGRRTELSGVPPGMRALIQQASRASTSSRQMAQQQRQGEEQETVEVL